jgi:hypothetical protein
MNEIISRVARDFPTQKALDDYLKDHPKANKSKHRVVENKGGPTAPKSEGGKDDHFKGQWQKALSERLGRPATEADFDILKGQMKQFVQKEKAKDKPVFDKKPQKAPELDQKDPFVKQWSKALSTQLGRPATQDDIDILKGKMRQFVQKAKEASVESRVAFRFIGSSI